MRFAVSPIRRTLAVLALALLAAVSACSTGEPPAGQESSAAGDASAFPVTIDTAFGPVTIAKPPQRVVALGWSDAEVALALGVEPVGVADWLAIGGDGRGPWVEQEYTSKPAQLGTLEVNRERLAALQPDLILDTRSSGERERYDQLSELGVPVVGIPKGAESYLTSWQDQLSMIGRALGKQDEADRLKRELDAKFAKAAKDHPEFDGASVVVAARTTESWGAYVDGDGRVEFMEKLGFTNSKAVQDQAGDSFFVSVSSERLDLLDADLTVVFPIGVDTGQITSDPLYRTIPSVKAGRAVVLSDPSISNAFSSASVTGLSYALDKTVPRFADALAR